MFPEITKSYLQKATKARTKNNVSCVAKKSRVHIEIFNFWHKIEISLNFFQFQNKNYGFERLIFSIWFAVEFPTFEFPPISSTNARMLENRFTEFLLWYTEFS